MSAPQRQPDRDTAHRLARWALDCAGREYPNQIAHRLRRAADLDPPRALHPAFHGCFDWHSAVHAHWTLARLARLIDAPPFEDEARAVLDAHLTEARVASEVKYLEPRPAFERPYGLAWVLQLAAELRAWDDPGAARWQTALAPLERLAAVRLGAYFETLTRPVRSGVHTQTAFAMALAADWSRTAGDARLGTTIAGRTRDLFGADRDWPLVYEPSGEDFLSPGLAEADLVRRFVSRSTFAAWLSAFLPDIPHGAPDDGWLAPVVPPDRTDGRLVHLDGLSLSRAWMLEGVAGGLPDDDPRRPALAAAAATHRAAGLAALEEGVQTYAGTHWLATFAVYLETARGRAPDAPAPREG